MPKTNCKKALVHHWLLRMTGAEKFCEAVCEIFDSVDVFCLVANASNLSPILRNCSITTSLVQRLPFATTHYPYYAPLFPFAVELFDLRTYDLVISSDAAVVKGVITRPDTCHVCYCHSPMRYGWNMFQDYIREGNKIKSAALSVVMHYLRIWDYAAAARVDYFVANSNAVKERIRKYYRRDSEVIYPPCDVKRFRIGNRPDNYYLCVGRLVSYKRMDLAVRAFNMNGKRLVVVGEGPEAQRLKTMAGKNIEFLGWTSEEELASLYSECRALIFPGEEDFGIVPVEAQASGRPVIAYGKGGALETLVPNKTGLFFAEQSPAVLNRAIGEFEAKMDQFEPGAIREHATRFSKERFQKAFAEHIQSCWHDHRQRLEVI